MGTKEQTETVWFPEANTIRERMCLNAYGSNRGVAEVIRRGVLRAAVGHSTATIASF